MFGRDEFMGSSEGGLSSTGWMEAIRRNGTLDSARLNALAELVNDRGMNQYTQEAQGRVGKGQGSHATSCRSLLTGASKLPFAALLAIQFGKNPTGARDRNDRADATGGVLGYEFNTAAAAIRSPSPTRTAAAGSPARCRPGRRSSARSFTASRWRRWIAAGSPACGAWRVARPLPEFSALRVEAGQSLAPVPQP
jgi:hypothetical protein